MIVTHYGVYLVDNNSIKIVTIFESIFSLSLEDNKNAKHCC